MEMTIKTLKDYHLSFIKIMHKKNGGTQAADAGHHI
jgi:hypothetical protein